MAAHAMVSWVIMEGTDVEIPLLACSRPRGRSDRRGDLARRGRHSRCVRNDHGLAKTGGLVDE